MALRRSKKQSDGSWLCFGSGVTCITPDGAFENERAGQAPVYFVTAKPGSPSYDAELAELTNKLNELVQSYHVKRKRPEAKVGFLLTSQGFYPVWKTYEADDKDFDMNSTGDFEGKSDQEIAALLDL